MRIKIISIILLFSINTSLWADLGDFKDDVEKEENENSQIEEADEDNNTEDNYSNENYSLFYFFWKFTFILWFYHNETVFYTPYPYETNGIEEGYNFIGHDKRDDDEREFNSQKFKNFHMALYGGVTVNEIADTFGGQFRLTGKVINHFGPEIGYRLLFDGTEILHNLSGGINLSLFQFDFFSFDLYIKAAFFMGLLNRQGISLGGIMRSYPFKPVSLEIYGGGLFFESITFAEVEIKLGFHFKATEIFGNFYTLQSKKSQLYSFGLGAGYHF